MDGDAMIFAGIDVNIITHEKAYAAGVEAMGLWLWGMCYAQTHGTDGRLPRLATLGAFLGKRNIMLAKRLVDAGLWSANEDGSWSIWNYGKKNQSAEDIERRKESRKAANAERQERWRERQKEPARNASVTQLPQRDSNEPVTPRNGPTTTTPLPLQNQTTTKPDLPPGGIAHPRPGLVRMDLPIAEDVETVWDQRTFTKSAGKPIADVWANFLGHFASTDFLAREALLGRWSKWVDKQCDIATKERHTDADKRDRDARFETERAARPSGFKVADTPPAPYHRPARQPRGERHGDPKQAAAAMAGVMAALGAKREAS